MIELDRDPQHKEKVKKANKYLESRLRKCSELDDYTALRENIHEVVSIIDTDNFKEKVRDRHDQLDNAKTTLNSQFKFTFWLTSVLIILFLIGVALTSLISNSNYATWVVLGVAIFLFGFNIIQIARTITNSLSIK